MEEKRTALVTGASRGIGRAIAEKLASQGVTVILGCSGQTATAESVAEEIRAAGGEAEVCSFRVEDAEAAAAAIRDLQKRYGSIDILVNNAGINRDGLLLRMSEDEFESVLQVNLMGTFHCTKAVLRSMMRKRSGRIINISSVSGVMGNAGQANYSASKAGIIGFTKAVAREVAGRGITVNAIAPGFIDTDMTKALPESVVTQVTEQIPMKHFGRPEDVAELAAFLASEGSGYITGQVIAVYGGMAM
ncbi:MAG: 3-oxoacyl-[acyl-carrier-protein] reductase [Lachnospiraceae bacterium]|nr:3-oxoacyl-[acyl-carrier-protein] reductase [Lachnospiraceae bacterium]